MNGIILLAAGSSSRLGQAKQLLSFQGKTLLQHSVEVALASSSAPVVVVLGANAEVITSHLAAYDVHLTINENWAEGMASSIRKGLSELQSIAPEATGGLFLLCDQPYVSTELLDSMVTVKGQTKKKMVACAYQDTLGAPVLFDQSLFPLLQQLQGHEGAKKIIARFPADTASVPFPLGAIDIDTPSEYAALQQREVGL
jgi:molybdenum cofactor cytidylyltransferase